MGQVLRMHVHAQEHSDKRGLRILPNNNSRLFAGKRCRWLYAVGFDDGRVKFGISSNPRDRIRGYWSAVGGAISWVHVFGPAPVVAGIRQSSHRKHPAEVMAVRNASQYGQQVGHSEYVLGVTRAQAVDCMRRAIAAVRSGEEG